MNCLLCKIRIRTCNIIILCFTLIHLVRRLDFLQQRKIPKHYKICAHSLAPNFTVFGTVKLVNMNNKAGISNLCLGSDAAHKCNSSKEQGPLSSLVKHLEKAFQSNTLNTTVLKLKMNGILWKSICNDIFYLFVWKEVVMIYLRSHFSICLEALRKTTWTCSQDSWGTNKAPPDYKWMCVFYVILK